MKWLLPLAVLVLLAGCSAWIPKTSLIEEISPVVMLYLNGTDGKGIEYTVVIPNVNREKKQILTAKGHLLKEIKSQLNRNYHREIKSGQMRILFLSEDLAKRGIINHLNTLILDQEISDRLYLAVIYGDLKNFLEKMITKQEGIDYFLYKLFRHYEKQGDLTIINLHRFLKSYYSPYGDPVLPIFRIRQEQLVYDGTAFFRNDRMVKAVRRDEDILFQFLCHPECFHTTISLPELNVVLGDVISTRRIRFSEDYSRATVTVHLRGRLEEYTGKRDLSSRDEATRLTKEMERFLENRMEDEIRSWQKLGIDPAQFGLKTLSAFHRPFTGSQWKRQWQNLPVTVRVELQMEFLGMIKPDKEK